MFWCGLFLHVCRGSAGVVLLVLLRVLACCCWCVMLAYVCVLFCFGCLGWVMCACVVIFSWCWSVGIAVVVRI